MTLRDAQILGAKKLKKARVDSPALDADLLLAEAVKKSKEWLFAHPEAPLKKNAEKKFRRLLARRARREPLAYILGRKEFYGLDFRVDRRALIPRPTTELIVDEVLRISGQSPIANRLPSNVETIIDVGTGSGAVAVTLAKLLPRARVFATDISRAALTLARANARRHGVSRRIKFLQGNLLQPYIKKIEDRRKKKGDCRLQTTDYSQRLIITANLPYLPTTEWQKTWPEIRCYEPRQALDGGPDGLKYIHALLLQIKNATELNRRGTVIILEFDPEQTKKLSALIRANFPRAKLQIKKDLGGLNRLTVIRF